MTAKNIQEDLKNLKVGDRIECNLHGAGQVTEAESATVKKIDEQAGIFWIDSSDGGYVKNSLYAYSTKTGMTINNMVPGFYLKVSAVIPKKTTPKNKASK